MSDYTLTTEQVCEEFAYAVGARAAEARYGEFDRWLSQVKAAVWEEAITAQLETQSAVRGITIQIAPNPYREEAK